MAGITSSVGLASGIDITGTVDQLIEIESVTRDNLQERTDALEEEQLAITELSAYLYAVKSLVVNLGKEDLYENKIANTSNDGILATVTSDSLAQEGSYTFTTLQTAQKEQWLSTGVVDQEASLGGGEFSFRYGDNLQRDLPLEILNGGDGIERGVIRITDRSGAWADIDLTKVQTLDDVVEAISSNLSINVTAELHGDGIRLIDDTGRSDVNLLVQEVSGSTAESLGLANVNVDASVAQGEDLVSLFNELDLTQLNDGNGISMAQDLYSGDINYTLADGTTGTVDFTPTNDSNGFEDPPTTLGELIERFNEAEPGKLEMSISADGKRLVVNDLTTGDPNLFTLTSDDLELSEALQDLGLTGEAEDGTITGRRLLGGTGSVLVSTLNGGSTETLGSIDLTDRTGSTTTVDLSGAETVEEVLDAINASGLAITAELNDAKNGIRLTDTSEATDSNLIVASSDDTDTAALLGIGADTSSTTIESGDLHQQIISESTRLEDLNGGAGVATGDFTVTGTNGVKTVFHLADPEIQTIGDLMRVASEGSSGIKIVINPDGDGILIEDTAHGSSDLKVTDNSKGSAADLNLTGEQELMDIDGVSTKVINGSSTHVVELEEGESLQDLADKINEIAGGATASIFSDGSIRPYRLILNSGQSGLDGAMVLDTSALGLSFKKTAEAKDAAIALGEADSGILLTSKDNNFTEVIEGVTIQANQASTTSTTITIDLDDTNLVATVQVMVDNYNNFRDRYNDLTSYNEATGETAILFGDSTARKVGSELGWTLADRYVGLGSIQTIRELGITISSSDGTLSFDEDTLTAKFAEDPEAVKEFFSSDPTEEDSGGPITLDDLEETPTVGAKGFAVVLDEMLESLVGTDVSVLARRYTTLDTKITNNEEHIEFLNERLEVRREKLLWDFYYMELAISKLQSYSSAIDSISVMNLDGSTSSSSSE